MAFLPIAVNLENKKILVAGGGRVAAHKIKTISLYTDRIFIVAPEVSGELMNRNYTVELKKYEKSDLEDVFIVYACTNDPLVNGLIAADAGEMGILVNVCDKPKLSSFVSPAVYKKNHMSVAVSSNGLDVHKSIVWRNLIREVLSGDKINRPGS